MKTNKKNTLLIPVIFLLLNFVFNGRVLSVPYHNDNSQDSIPEADSLMSEGYKYYDTNPKKCVKFMSEAAKLYEKGGMKHEQALCLQDCAFAYYSKLGDYKKALPFVQEATKLYHEINESNNEANLLKYLGLLQAKNKEYALGKESIAKAIKIFENTGFKAGIAVAYFDLADVYQFQNMTDSCIFYLKKNKEFFETAGDTSRIFIVNSCLIDNYSNSDQLEKAAEIQKYNSTIEDAPTLYFENQLEYYSVCEKYFKKVKNRKMQTEYRNKRTLMIKKFKKAGVI